MNSPKKQNFPISSNLPDFWKDMLGSTQIFAKDYSHLPQVKACKLRMAYSKLQPPKLTKNQIKIQYLQKTRGSFLLDKSTRNLSSILSNNKNQQNSHQTNIDDINTRYTKTRYLSIQSPRLIRTIDVAEIKKMSGSKRNLSPNLSNSGSIKRSREFSDYFKKIISSQKANNDPNKLFSQGRGLDIQDRTHFEKFQRVKLSILNQKIISKQHSFQCVKTKLNDYRTTPPLPQVKKKIQNTSPRKFYKKHADMTTKQKLTSMGCQPWESDSIFHDIQQ